MNNLAGDRERWNARYQSGAEGGTPLMLGRNLHYFPRSGRGIDVAGGPGQAAVILAARGLDMTLTDISDVALEMAAERAQRSRLELDLVNIDLSDEPLPKGPWDLITCFNYLDRTLFPAMMAELTEGGLLAVSLATRTNLERHERPGSGYLLDDGELRSLLGDLSLMYYQEGWSLDGRYTAEAIAKMV